MHTNKHAIIISTLLLLLLFLAVSFVALVYAENLIVSATVPPHYAVKAQGDTLFLQTNMKLYVNGERLAY